MKSVKINPKFAYGYFGLGKANLELNKLDESCNYFSKAVELNPDFFEANFNLGYAYYLMGWENTLIT